MKKTKAAPVFSFTPLKSPAINGGVKAPSFLTGFTFLYLCVLGILAALALANYVILRENIKSNEGSAALINTSGRQRMFSQRIAFLTLTLAITEDSQERERLRKELSKAISLMESSHHDLISDTTPLKRRGALSREAKDIYFSEPLNVDAQVREYLIKARISLTLSDTQMSLQDPNIQYVVSAAEGNLPRSLDRAVWQYQAESEAKIRRLKALEGWVFLITAGILFMTGVFLFNPMLKRIQQKTQILQYNEAQLQETNKLLHLKIQEANALEKQLRSMHEFDEALLRTIPFGIDIVDEEGDILYMNEKMQKAFGENVLGKKCYLLYKDDKQRCVNCPLKNGVEIGEVKEIEVKGVLGDKTYLIIHTGMLYHGRKAILEIFEDISGYIHTQEQLALAERLAGIGRMAGIIAHEFRNQLAVIRNAVYFLKMKIQDKDEKIQRHLSILDEQVVGTERIIENILTFSRNKQPDLQMFELKELLEASIKRVLIPEGIEVIMPAEGLPLIEADPVQMSTVFTNIIVNAVQSMNGHGKILIEVTKNDKYVIITFSDSGKGVKDEDKKKLFEPFFSTKARGTGLGLATAKIILKGHRGEITMESEYGKGAAVTIMLPVDKNAGA